MIRLPLQLLLLLLTSTAHLTSAIPASSRLFLRQDSCLADFESCGDELPNNFCCPEKTKCLSLAGDTTVLCCPEGSDCNKIETVPCDLNEMDPEEFPEAPIKTSVFDVELEKCGDNCCPFGYSCNSSGQCQKKSDQSQAPKAKEDDEQPETTTTTKTATTETEEPTSEPEETETDAPAATTTDDPTDSDDGEEDSDDENSGPNTGAIVGGVVGGCAVLLLVAIALFVVVRRRNSGRNPSSSSSSSSPALTEKTRHRRIKTRSAGFSNIISDPISQPDQYRTDFILHPPSAATTAADRWLDRQPSNASRAAPIRPPRISIPNPFSSPNPSVAGSAVSRASTASSSFGDVRTGHVVHAARLAPIRSMKASSRHLRPADAYGYASHGNPSAESIDIFADPRAVDRPLTHQTTFTDLMDEADLSGVGRDRPFVQVPGTTPRI